MKDGALATKPVGPESHATANGLSAQRAPLGTSNQAIQDHIRTGGSPAGLPGAPLGNQDAQRHGRERGANRAAAAPRGCTKCAQKAAVFGVQTKCAECAARGPATCRDCGDRSLDGAKPALDGASQPLPHHDQIQASFGRHDLSSVRTLTGGAARDANDSLGAHAFTAGDRIGFRETPDAWLAAHESAHVIQQRDGTSTPDAGDGDPWERHADHVADAVVSGRSAEPLLDDVTRDEGGDAPTLQLDDDKDKRTQANPNETQDEFEQRVKDLAVSRLTENIATLGQWSNYVSAMQAFQLQTQLETSKVMDWATTAANLPSGDRKFEDLVGTEDWGQRSYLEQQLSGDATYRSRVSGFEDLLRSHSFGYYTSPSIAKKLQVTAGELDASDLPASTWVAADPRYELYRETLQRVDRGEINSGCQYCHEINLDWDMTAKTYGSALPEGNFWAASAAFSRQDDFAKLFNSTGIAKRPQQADGGIDDETADELLEFVRAGQPPPSPQQQQPTPEQGQPDVNPFVPAIEVPAVVTVPPPRTDLCGSLPEAPAGAPSSDFSSWGANSAIVAKIVASVDAVLTPLGPRGYRVLTSDTFDALWSMTPDGVEAVRAQILSQIQERVDKYGELRGQVPDEPYYELCPIVDELLPTTSDEVRDQAQSDVWWMRSGETVVTIAELALVALTFMFPPAAIVTMPSLMALGFVRAGMGVEQMRQGDEWSLGIGGGVYSPEQEAQAESLRTRGIINIATGLFGAATGAVGIRGAVAEAPEELISIIKTPAGYMVTHADYPGCAIWIEGNAVEAMNEAGDVVATGVITPNGVVWNPGAYSGGAADASTAMVPFGPTAMAPYQSGLGPTPAAYDVNPPGSYLPQLAPNTLPKFTSTALGKNLMESFGLSRGTSFSGWQPHHILPKEAASLPALQGLDVNFDDPTNGIMLPNRATFNAGIGRPLPAHTGFHGYYNQAMVEAISKIDPTLPASIREIELYNLQQRARAALTAGAPLYDADGATVDLWRGILNGK